MSQDKLIHCSTATNITDEGKRKYVTAVEKFDAFSQVRNNVIFEQAKFSRRNQLKGELIEQYITALYHLVDSCDYGMQKEEMRDRIVMGIRDKVS